MDECSTCDLNKKCFKSDQIKSIDHQEKMNQIIV